MSCIELNNHHMCRNLTVMVMVMLMKRCPLLSQTSWKFQRALRQEE